MGDEAVRYIEKRRWLVIEEVVFNPPVHGFKSNIDRVPFFFRIWRLSSGLGREGKGREGGRALVVP